MIPSGKELRTLRETLGLTQKELARRIGVSQSFIAKIENEKIDPRLSIGGFTGHACWARFHGPRLLEDSRSW